jgi:hypothetical protein
MTLQYPIADSARLALLDPCPMAGSEMTARQAAGGPVNLALEWVRPNTEEASLFEEAAQAALASGFVQVYQDARGQPVLAVTFWRREPVEEQLDVLQGLEPVQPSASESGTSQEDLTPILPVVPTEVRGIEDRIVGAGDAPVRSKGRPKSREETRQLGLFSDDDLI